MEISAQLINYLLLQSDNQDLPELEGLFGEKGEQPGKMFEQILFELARHTSEIDFARGGQEDLPPVAISKEGPMPVWNQELSEEKKDTQPVVTGGIFSEHLFSEQSPLEIAAASGQIISDNDPFKKDHATFASRGSQRGDDNFKAHRELTGFAEKISPDGNWAESKSSDTQGGSKQQKGEAILKAAPGVNSHTGTSTHLPSKIGEVKIALSEALKEGRQIYVKEETLNDSYAKTDKEVADHQDRFSNGKSDRQGPAIKHSLAGDGTQRASGHRVDDKPSGALNISLKNEKDPQAFRRQGKLNNLASKHAEATARMKDALHFREGQNADARVHSSGEVRQNIPDPYEIKWQQREMSTGLRESSIARLSGREAKVERQDPSGTEFRSERQPDGRVFMEEQKKTFTGTPQQRHGFSFKDLSAPSETLDKTLSPNEKASASQRIKQDNAQHGVLHYSEKEEFHEINTSQRQGVWTKQHTFDGNISNIQSRAKTMAHDKATGMEKADALHQPVGTHNVSPQKMSQDNIPTAQIIDRISAKFIEIADKDGGRVKVSLSPPNLGNLEMDVMLRNGTLRVVLVAESKDVHQALTANMETLKGALQSHGLIIERCEVMLQDRPDHYWQGSGQQQAFERDQSGTHGSSSAAVPEYELAEVTPATARNINQTARGEGKISLFV